jgi:hypothetical protein
VALTPLRAGPSCSLPGQALKQSQEGSLLDADLGSRLRTLSNRGWLPFTGYEVR